MSSLFSLPVPYPNVLRRDLHGAALLDEQGRETPITEAMILRACDLAADHCMSVQYRAAQNVNPRARRAG